MPCFVEVRRNVEGSAPSPGGARVVFGARGELFSVPAKDGPTRNLSGTQGVRERAPAWSPDGKLLAYVSDATGDPELYVRPLDASAAPRQLTNHPAHDRNPSWSLGGPLVKGVPDADWLQVGFRLVRPDRLSRTVGLMLNSSKAQPGYTLMSPMHSSTTYLLDNAGNYVRKWVSTGEPGRSSDGFPASH